MTQTPSTDLEGLARMGALFAALLAAVDSYGAAQPA
jgi:hypothetical protein